jgi:hypothetical protein
MSNWDGTKWVADAPPVPKSASRVKRVAAATLEASLVVALTFGLIAGSAFAAKGGEKGKPGGGGGNGGGGNTGGSGTLSAPVNLTDSVLSHGDRIRFDVTSSVAEPWVRLSCYQGGALVAQGSEGYFERSLDDGVFGLYSPMWASGAADCTAKLTNSSGSVLATTSFHVDA